MRALRVALRRPQGRRLPPRRTARARRLVAGLLLAAAVAVGVDALAPSADPGAPVAATTRDLPAGHVLGAADVTTVRLPAAAVPAGALAPGRAQGARLSAAVRAGEVLTDARVRAAGLLTGAPPGSWAVPVRVEGEALALVSPGDPVAVLAGADLTSPEAHGEVIVEDATVLHVPVADSGLLAAEDTGRTVVLALDRAEATRVAATAGRRPLLLAVLP